MSNELLKAAIESLPSKEAKKDYWARVWQFQDDMLKEVINELNQDNEK